MKYTLRPLQYAPEYRHRIMMMEDRRIVTDELVRAPTDCPLKREHCAEDQEICPRYLGIRQINKVVCQEEEES